MIARISLVLSLMLAAVSAGAQTAATADVPPPAGAFPGEEVLLDHLAGVVVFPGEAPFRSAGPLHTAGLDISRTPFLQTADFRAIMGAFLNQPVSPESLKRLTRSIEFYAASLQRPFITAYLPPQDITAGTLAVVVRESVADERFTIEGNRWFGDDSYQRFVRQQPGDRIDLQRLREDVAWINRNGFRSARLTASPGAEPGTTRVGVSVRETRPWRFTSGYNNSGTATSDTDRLNAGVTWANAFGRADLWNLNLSADPAVHHYRALSTGYTAFLPWRHILTVRGNVALTDGIVAAPFELDGTSWQVALDYEVPLAPAAGGRLTRTAYLGLDFKASDNNFAFARIPITDNLTHVAQARFGLRGTWSPAPGQSVAYDLSLAAAPGDLTGHNTDAWFTNSRTDAHARYVYGRINLSYLRPLPRGFAWQARLSGQFASTRLIGSEQFAAGGSAGPRGYEEGEVYGDHGLALQQEFQLPARSNLLGRLLADTRDTLQVFGFVDAARVWNRGESGPAAATTLLSAGPGLRYSIGSSLSLSLAHGWQLKTTPFSNSGDEQRTHLSLSARF